MAEDSMTKEQKCEEHVERSDRSPAYYVERSTAGISELCYQCYALPILRTVCDWQHGPLIRKNGRRVPQVPQ